MPRLKPLNDFIFQKLFGEKGRENELISLLNAILYSVNTEERITSVEIIESKKLVAEMIGDKTGILDIRAITDKGTHINIEVQRRDYGNMHLRSPFYLSMLLSKAIREGEDYNELTKVVAINILDFEYIQLPEFHTTFHMREDKHTHYVLTDTMEIHYIEMPKFRKMKSKDYNNSLHRWLLFFDEKTPENVVKELVEMDTAIRESYDYLDTLSGDAETVRLFQAREMAVFDYKSGIANAKKEGKIEGKKEGKIEGRKESSIEIAKKLLRRGNCIQDVLEYTELDFETVTKLQKEISS